MSLGKDDDRTVDERKSIETLSDYGFHSLSTLNEQVCRYLQQGYVDSEGFSQAVLEANDQADAQAASGSMSEAWDLLHDTFGDNADHFVETMLERATTGARWLGYFEAETIAYVLRSLGSEHMADAFTQSWIEASESASPLRLLLPTDRVGNDGRDEKFRTSVASKVAASEEIPTLEETIQGLVGRNSVTPVDVRVLAAATVEDYVEFFKGAGSGPDLTACVRACLELGEFTSPNNSYQKIGATVSDALRRIALESPINALRVGKFRLMCSPASTSHEV